MLLDRRGSPRHAYVVLAALVCWTAGALVAPSPAVATAAWLPAQALTESGQESYGSVVAADPQGTVLAAWTSNEGLGTKTHVYTAVRPPGGAFGSDVRMSPLGTYANGPAVAFDSQGNAIAVWASEGIVEAAVRPPGGNFGPAQELSPGSESASSPQVIFDSQGNAIIVWTSVAGVSPNFTYRVWESVRPAGGSFGLPHELDSAKTSSIDHSVNFFSIHLAADQLGNVFAVWSLTSEEFGGLESNSSSVKTALRPAAGPFLTAETLASASGFGPTTERVRESDVAADPQGDALVVWGKSSFTAQSIEGKMRPAGGAFEAKAENVSGTAEGSFAPRVAFDQNGNAVAVWTGVVSKTASVLTAPRPRGGGFGSPQLLSPLGVLTSRPVVAVQPNGGTLAAWLRYGEPSQIEAAARPPGGSFGAPLPVSPTGKSGTVGEPSLAVDGLGDAAATWRRIEKTYRAEVAGYDDAAPTLQSLSIPTHGTAGQPLAFSVSPLDVWSALAPTTWSFGDGSGVGASVTHTYAAAGTYKVMLSSADVLGNATSTSATVAIGPMISARAPTTPVIASATETNRIWREGNKLAQISKKKKPPVGTTFSFTLNEQASVRFAFTQKVGGRKVNGKCIAQTPRNRDKHACKRAVTRGTLSFASHSGTNKVIFQGRLSRSKKLKPGHYTLIITATNSAGARSAPASLSFTIVK